MLESVGNIVLLVLGFGFVIFWHELGHFLAAKWCDVRVEQFAVGFGQAICSWRKGLGWSWGSSGQRYERMLKGEAEVPAGVDPKQIGETEYRWNWVPLGGYVKMLGQDDLRPNAQADDPRAYNRKSIGQRMIIVSAGVIMNIILAAIGFMVVFMMGFNAPPTVVGSVQPLSPAQQTRQVLADGKPGPVKPLQVGDRLLMFDGKWQHDFTKISLNTALAEADRPTLLYVHRAGTPEDQGERLYITPQRDPEAGKGFLMLGVGQPVELRGPAPVKGEAAKLDLSQHVPAQSLLLQPGDTIVAIQGEAVKVNEYYKLDQAIQTSDGSPVAVTIRDDKGQERQAEVLPSFQTPFGGADLEFAGMLPRPAITTILDDSTAVGKIVPGDVVVKIADKDGSLSNPTGEALRKKLSETGLKGTRITLTVLRGDEEVEVPDLSPSIRLGKDKEGNTRYGMGVGLGYDERHAVVADTLAETPARKAGIPAGAKITAINHQPVNNWFDVKRLLSQATPGQALLVAAEQDGQRQSYPLTLDAGEIQKLAAYNYTTLLRLHELVEPRIAKNPLQAMQWGVIETRDFTLQFYVTIQRMFQGSVSYKNMMGPVGIFTAGTHFAEKGKDWLIWFLAMISANLAVVNFLPIPIVDGGLFTFLLIEKLQGKPLSARTQSIAQIVGLALILGVFLLVTYQDIARIGGY